MKQTIKINFADFWTHLNKTKNYFFNLLSEKYTVEISYNPDFLIYSCYGTEHLKYNCLKVFYNGENERINWNACDFAFGMDYIPNNPRYYRLPNWILYDKPGNLILPGPDAETILASKTGFCNMLVSNKHAKKRIDFFHKLSKYKKVDSGGRVLNNIGKPVSDKLSFIKNYKFTLAFENSSYPGYTTEKLFEPMLVNSIPIYWGNPKVGLDFNTKSFLNSFDYKNEDAFINKIIELDNNDNLYLKMLQEPWFIDNKLPEFIKEKNVLNQFEIIVNSVGKINPVCTTYKKAFYHFSRLKKRIISKINTYIPIKSVFR